MKLPAMDRLPIPMFKTDSSGILTYVNQMWQSTIGTPTGSYWYESFNDLDLDALTDLWRDCADHERPFTLHARSQPEDRLPIWFELVGQPVIQDPGEATEVLCTLIDLTSQTQAVAEINAILDTAVDGIISIDDAGRIESFNQAARTLFGYTAEEIMGQPVTLLMPEVHKSNHDAYVQRYIQTGEKRIIGIGRELEAIDKGGRLFPIYLAVSEINIAGRRRFTGIIRDLTDQYAARETLIEQREKLAHVGRLSTMGEMTASIAHEINQPLTAISMYSQAGIKLLDRGGNLDTLRNALDKLNTQALRAGAIIERIQRFARAQESVRQLVDLNDLMEDLLELAESDARLHSIDLELSLESDLPRLLGDPIQIQQVVLNLIRNAIDAMSEIGCRNGRRIILATRQSAPNEAEVSVKDLGKGVAEDQKDLLFTPFHTTKKEGMGMGLSICKSIIAEHNGELSYVNNDTDNGEPGATFYFRLPINTDE